MSGVSVIGLGPMGSALARALLRGSYRVTVWNRTRRNTEPLVRDGASEARSARDALVASPIPIACVADYAAARSILNATSSTPDLSGHTLVQLSTGSPKEARESESWARERGIDYIDGAILVAPSQIGTPESAILASGSRTAFQRTDSTLKSVAPNLTYLGEEVGSAAALDLAFLSHFFGGLLGFYHGARILEAERMPVTALGSMIAAVAPALGQIIDHDAGVIQADRYENPESTLKNSATVVELLVRHARDARINADFPEFASALFRKGMAAGYGREDVAALMKALRTGT
jgi:3-hydroxyisobutyrate dehydrogenase-like beta-hydroxyacid dehydrogenase